MVAFWFVGCSGEAQSCTSYTSNLGNCGWPGTPASRLWNPSVICAERMCLQTCNSWTVQDKQLASSEWQGRLSSYLALLSLTFSSLPLPFPSLLTPPLLFLSPSLPFLSFPFLPLPSFSLPFPPLPSLPFPFPSPFLSFLFSLSLWSPDWLGIQHVAQSSLKLTSMFLPQPPKCWIIDCDHTRHGPSFNNTRTLLPNIPSFLGAWWHDGSSSLYL